MSNKKILLSDVENINDIHFTSRPRGHVIFKDPITGKVLLEKDNKVLISGSQVTACALFDIDEPFVRLETYNEALNLENTNTKRNFQAIPNDTFSDDPTISVNRKQKSNIWLFCCGTDGCKTEDSQVLDVRYTGRIDPDYIIPFRVRHTNDDIDDEMRQQYFGRRVHSVDGTPYFEYYFKTFENSAPNGGKLTPYMRYVDGTAINATDMYSNETTLDAEVFVELSLRITKDDFREYFDLNSAANLARINNVSLCTAWREKIGGHYYYQDIIPVTQINIPNESLVDRTKGIDITYQVFF